MTALLTAHAASQQYTNLLNAVCCGQLYCGRSVWGECCCMLQRVSCVLAALQQTNPIGSNHNNVACTVRTPATQLCMVNNTRSLTSRLRALPCRLQSTHPMKHDGGRTCARALLVNIGYKHHHMVIHVQLFDLCGPQQEANTHTSAPSGLRGCLNTSSATTS